MFRYRLFSILAQFSLVIIPGFLFGYGDSYLHSSLLADLEITRYDLQQSYPKMTQDSIGTTYTATLTIGDDYKIFLGIENDPIGNIYNWFKDGAPYTIVSGQDFLQLTMLQVSDEGIYTCMVTNPDSLGYTVHSRPVTIRLVGTCRERDSLVLVELYNSLNGLNWTRVWELAEPIDKWYGVYLNSEKCVTKVSLSENNLSGIIPLHVGELIDLSELFLNSNQLFGYIPKEISGLNNLLVMYLYFNNLSGNIPSEFGELESIEKIRLNGNNLTGRIPKEIGKLKYLKMLQLSNNQLSGEIPNEFGNLESLTSLALSANKLEGIIPTQLGKLINLKSLSLFHNQIKGKIPNEICNLVGLDFLSLYSNYLDGPIPKDIDKLSQLTVLRLNDNLLSGNIPEEMKSNELLQSVYLHNNKLEGCFPVDITKYCSLGFNPNANLSGYNFTGNPGLPWGGDFERFCNGEDQIGAPCDDGDPNTINDIITADCECNGEIHCNPEIVLDKVIIRRNKESVLGSIELIISGGFGNLSATWTNGTKGLKLVNVLPGVYSCQVSDESGCVLSFGPFEIGKTVLEDNSTYVAIGDSLIHPLVGMPDNHLQPHDNNENPEFVTSTYSNEFLNEVLIYPNPIKDILNVTLSVDKIESIHMSILNITGATLGYQNFVDYTLKTHFDLSNLPAGIYFISIQTDQGRTVRKIIKS